MVLCLGTLSLSMAELANMKCRPTAKEKKGRDLQTLNKDRMRQEEGQEMRGKRASMIWVSFIPIESEC